MELNDPYRWDNTPLNTFKVQQKIPIKRLETTIPLTHLSGFADQHGVTHGQK